jgi:hypothetical protein
MLRAQAIEDLLIDDVAQLRRSETSNEERREELVKARQRAIMVAIFDWAAIAALFLLRDPAASFLAFGAGEETVFTLAIVAVAAHSGFRLGQWEKYRAVERAVEALGRFC